MTTADWWTVSYTVALIALAAMATGVVAVRVLAACAAVLRETAPGASAVASMER